VTRLRIACSAVLLVATAARAQTAVTVGDRFVSVVEVPVPAGARLEVAFPEDSTARVQPVGPVRQEPGADGAVRASVTMVAWTVGPGATVAAEGRIVGASGDARPVRLAFRVPEVRSVLPRDTVGLQPRPPKDVIGPDRRIEWLWVLAAAAAAAWLAVLWTWHRRRRRARPTAIVAPADARVQALEALAAARASGLAERGDSRAFYTLLTDALRGFAHAVRPRWSPDLTTGELQERMARDGVAPHDLGALRGLLRTADVAKFGRGAVPADTALRDLDEASRWVETFGREERAARPEEAAR
jgi:hypothetical protein